MEFQPRSPQPKLVVFTGAGISAESGIETFRDLNGLWQNHRIEDVASPAGWSRNRELVLEFYNQRRLRVLAAKPNPAHFAIAGLEAKFEVTVVTQNIDDLHERAGSSKVIHLHGEILKGQSSHNPNIVFPLPGARIELGDKCPKGSQVRPNVVWFGETILRWKESMAAVAQADVFIICGTSLNVQPASELHLAVPPGAKRFLVDPNPPAIDSEWVVLREPATTAIPSLANRLLTTFTVA